MQYFVFNNPGLASERRKGFYSSAFYSRFCKGPPLDCIHNFLCCHLRQQMANCQGGVQLPAWNGNVLEQSGTKYGCKKKECKTKSKHNLARAAKINCTSIYLFQKSPSPGNSSNDKKMENHFTPPSVTAHPCLRLCALIKAGWEEH